MHKQLRYLFLAIVIFILFFTYFVSQGIEEWKGRPMGKKISKCCSEMLQKNPAIRIAIVQVIDKDTASYQYAIQSVLCYSLIQNYEVRLLNGSAHQNFSCPHRNIFFRRHCLVAHFLRDSKEVNYVLFMDSDIGVVNPKRRIEDFVDPKMEIIFYDRFFNWEVAAGSYLVRNSNWSQAFLQGFADYEYRLPKSFHGNDNGALHAYLAERILPENNVELPVCLDIYNHTKKYADLFLYEACIRNALGNNITFGKIKILRKGTAWVRDNWITNSKWNEERDFMIHNWKTQDLKNYSEIPVRPLGGEYSTWYNPIDGPLELSLCAPGNTTWRYDPNLVASREEIDDQLQDFARSVDIERQKSNRELKHYFNIKE